ncbi:hypothetical protein PM082_021826 [Marasmius tenuissimus]|nr:hypothetical protein PM082_021826 [Marasmius tenuissimus]
MALVTTIDNTFGLLYIGTCLSFILYGFACLQIWWYFRCYGGRDPWLVQAVVSAVLLCDTIQMATMSGSFYQYCITAHGHSEPIGLTLEPLFMIQFYFGGAIAVLVQMFYCWRIYKISKSTVIPSLVAGAGWISFLANNTSSSIVLIRRYPIDEWHRPELLVLSTILMISAVVCDIAITGVIMYYLQRSKTGIRKSTNIINRMILFTFSAGIPASTCILLALISQFAFPNTFLFVFFYLVCGRFYTNSLLVTLNGRQYIIEGTMARISFNLPRGNLKNPQPRRIRKTTTSVPMVTLTLGTRDKKSDKPLERSGKEGLSSSTSTSSAPANNQV